MGNEISLARKENQRQPVLLVSSGTGICGEESKSGDQGQVSNSNATGNETEKAVNTTPKGKGNAKNKRGKRRRGCTYSLRESIREAERRNPAGGRTAQELGIRWVEDRCEPSPVTKAHYFEDRMNIDSGSIFKCRYCHQVKWLPNTFQEAYLLSYKMKVYGEEKGYQLILDLHPSARRMLSKIQDIHYLRKILPDEQFGIAVAAIILDREFPFDVSIREEDIL